MYDSLIPRDMCVLCLPIPYPGPWEHVESCLGVEEEDP